MLMLSFIIYLASFSDQSQEIRFDHLFDFSISHGVFNSDAARDGVGPVHEQLRPVD